MITISLFEAVAAIGGRVNKQISPTAYINQITHNSNEVSSGGLFVAIKGERVDGHDFVKGAEEQGAIAVVVEREVEGLDIPQVIVPSSLEALGGLSKLWRFRCAIPIVAVTGSVGKTTTKELTAHVLSGKFTTHKGRKNYNNELGVPLELLRLQPVDECSVVEFGMRGTNQINYLAKIARPTVGIITNIGVSHIELLGTRENIAHAKSEILEGIDSQGAIVLNRDDDFFELISKKANCKVVSFGENSSADVVISDITLDDNAHPSFKLNGIAINMKNVAGRHHAFNAAAAYTAAKQLGVSDEVIVAQIESFEAPEKRGHITKLANQALLLDSTYNAAPDSIKASLFTLDEIAENANRAIAVVGDMLELGDYSKEAHSHVGKVISEMKTTLDVLVTVGDNARFIAEKANAKANKHFENSSQAATYISEELSDKDAILIQGSNGIKLNKVVDALKDKFGEV